MRATIGRLAVGAAVMFAAAAAQGQVSIRIGDNDGYGFGVPDNGTAVWPCYICYDGRSAAEAAATDGSQATDVYASMFPGAGPNTFTSVQLVFTLPSAITAGTFTVDMGDFQVPTYMSVSYNGVLQPGLFGFSDGFQATVVRSFVLDAAAITNANAAGAFIVDLDGSSQSDYVAFDYFQLDARISAVPEPATVALTGLGLAVLAFARRRRRA